MTDLGSRMGCPAVFLSEPMQGLEGQVQRQVSLCLAIICHLHKLRISERFIQSHIQRFLQALKHHLRKVPCYNAVHNRFQKHTNCTS